MQFYFIIFSNFVIACDQISIMSTELENEFVAKSLPELYLKSDFADIYFAFIIAKGTIALVPAHKIILSVNSPVFKKKFFGPLKDVFVNVDKTVKVNTSSEFSKIILQNISLFRQTSHLIYFIIFFAKFV